MVSKSAVLAPKTIERAVVTLKQQLSLDNCSRSLYVPLSVPDPRDPLSLERNGADIKSVIEKHCPRGRRLKNPSGYKGLKIDQITFFTVLNKVEGFRYNPHHTERLKNGGDETYDDLVPFPMSRYFLSAHREVPRVISYSDAGVFIRVTMQELSQIIKDGGNIFKFHKSKKWEDEYRIWIPFSNILEVVFIERN